DRHFDRPRTGSPFWPRNPGHLRQRPESFQVPPDRGRTAPQARAGKLRAVRREEGMRMPDAVVILVTAGSEAEAELIAKALVDERLAACVHTPPPLPSR